MSKYKVGVAGYFAKGKSKAGGQEAKTWSIYNGMVDRYGRDKVTYADTTDWKKHPLNLLTDLIRLSRECDNIIMLPAQKSIRFFIPILLFLNAFNKKRLFYSVVGGWLPVFLEKHIRLANEARRLDRIFVETISMKEALEKKKFRNITVVPNFKDLKPLKADELVYDKVMPFRICTFSRVMKEKGIEDVIKATTEINEKYKKAIFQLDIYGKVDEGYAERFKTLKETFPNYVNYKGIIEPNKSVEVIKDYFALIFPTHYYTEGVPGTLIDAYMSGVPAIVSLWGNSGDVFIDNVTGWGYEFKSYSGLIECLERIVKNPESFLKMKKSCLHEANRFLPKSNIELMCSYFK